MKVSLVGPVTELLHDPREPREYQDVKVADDLPDGWQCTYRVVAQDGQPVVAELCIHPSGEVPRGGLNTRVLRQVRLGKHVAALTGVIRRSLSRGRAREERTVDIPAAPGRAPQTRIDFGPDDIDRDLFEGLGFEKPPPERRPGRPRSTSDRELADLAAAYVTAIEEGSVNPVAVAALERSYSHSHARDKLHEARERGLLTRPPTAGRAGGELTQKARALVS